MKFTDTRTGAENGLSFSEVIVKGIAPSGGLFVPTSLPEINLDEIRALAHMPYWQQAAFVYRLFDLDIDGQIIDQVMQDAYGSQWASAKADVVAPLTTLKDDVHVLELTHGPTSAFKDMALQCMPRLLSVALDDLKSRGALSDDLLVLVATSGDTGKAALDGFADRAGTSIIVFYPEDGVSDLQKKQMTTQAGDNVAVFALSGNFDDCQNAVKSAFVDDEFSDWLAENNGLRLSSANSINWGRLMPQIVYYLSACGRLMTGGQLKDGQLLDIAVPTGNFGNILGAWYAKQMGAPIGRLICASNSNDVLCDFINEGVYDISDRPFFVTPSPSMDILISSNLERLLYHLAGAEKTVKWMNELKTEGSFTVDDQTLDALQEGFVGGWIGDDESLRRIERCWRKYRYLIDPHTAVGLDIALQERGENPVLVVATAHWAKFAPSVLRALLKVGFDEDLLEPYARHNDFETLNDVTAIAQGCAPVPQSIEGLRTTPARFKQVIDPTPDAIKGAVQDWLGGA
jgi:threonine synthase